MASPTDSEQVGRRGAILEAALVAGREALRRQVLRHSPDESSAEEALQEASIDFLGSYDGPAGVDAVRWLQVAVKRRAWELGRKHRAHLRRVVPRRPEQPELDPPDAAAGPLERMVRAAVVAEFIQTLELLKPDERAGLLLSAIGLTYREIGERQGWTMTKVNRCVNEGRAALRRLVG